MKRAWTRPFQTSRTRTIYHDYDTLDQWTKDHQEFQESPAPKKGHSYLAHASALMPLLDAFSQLHPVAGVVITAFKTAVTYEQMREENDARVAVVFLAQADLMSFFLTTKQLSNQLGRQPLDQNDIRIDGQLQFTLNNITDEIVACGNSMDVYYGEKRIVKYLKAREWKERIEEHMNMFYQWRTQLSQILTVRIAADTNNMVDEMHSLNATVRTMLSHLFLPKAGWERDVDQRRLELIKEGSRDSKEMLNDPEVLQTLADLTQDPLLDSKRTEENLRGSKAVNSVRALTTEIDLLKKDLNSSLEVLCKRNEETFKLKLDFHTEQLQNAIHDSAQYVVQSLSGPHDRLRNEDLKILWKEMNWIFCVDNKHFTNALFEYYLDHFSSLKEVAADIENGPESQLQKLKEGRRAKVYENLTKVTFLSRMGVLNHVDAWTLEPMAMYGDRIANSVDRDESGYIRISEVNSFTDRMPEGWTLPQWCAYAAIGWTYEARIYRKRMNNILGRMFEMHGKVLPANRFFMLVITQSYTPFFQLLAWEPWDTTNAGHEKYPSPVADLRNLVHDKMKHQDNILRNKLQKLHWAVEDETMLHILCGKEPLETYVLQITVLLLERAYEVMQACTKVTIDAEELSHLSTPLDLLKNVCTSHVTSLKAQWKKEKKRDNYISSFHGGIWDCIDQVNEKTFSLPFEREDIEDFVSDDKVLDKFSPPMLVDGKLPYLKYKPWEEFIKLLTPENIPEEVPNTWDDHDGAFEKNMSYRNRSGMAQFPLVFRNCNICHKELEQECYYACTVCYDFDMCSKCYKCSKDKDVTDSHHFSHPVLRFALPTPHIPRQWIVLDSQLQTKHIQEDVSVLLEQNKQSDEALGWETSSSEDTGFNVDDVEQLTEGVIYEEPGEIDAFSSKAEPNNRDPDRIVSTEGHVHEEPEERDGHSKPEDMKITDLISNMNGEQSIESEACNDGRERDSCLESKNTGHYSDVEQSVQDKIIEVVEGNRFRENIFDDKTVDENVAGEDGKDSVELPRGCDSYVRGSAEGEAHEETGERENLLYPATRDSLQMAETEPCEEVEEKAVFSMPIDIDLGGEDTREAREREHKSEPGSVDAAHSTADEPRETAEKQQADFQPEDSVVEVTLKKYKSCNCCNGNIALDNIATFYKCFRHSCSNYWLCDSCVDKRIVDKDPDGHQWWHSLIVLRHQIIFPGVDTAELNRNKSQETHTKDPSDSSSGGNDLGNRISAVVAEKLDVTHLMLQSALKSFVDSQTKSAEVQGDESIIHHRIGEFEDRIESRISRLEDKVDMMCGEMRAFFSTFAIRPGAEI
ncbi:hypothetical protein HYPSUDRAFT_1079957 [Hypholoma sublateritium FD-334 SS-4]|uniref:ZZ-type domain-containing protein n=1 Tax=Hypholoma sublateritium (strain FD-334 SS-4) TaxID=945553 RepID=A0A0D2MJC6_HYPSF|nr:hypothetical protein HYPSUDRAFT_1079957 [Hypholoma sublateritium FD-334 SS-4]